MVEYIWLCCKLMIPLPIASVDNVSGITEKFNRRCQVLGDIVKDYGADPTGQKVSVCPAA